MMEKEFNISFNLLKERNPNHPLIGAINEGYSTVTIAYLRHAYNTIDLGMVVKATNNETSSPEPSPEANSTPDDSMTRLFVRKKVLLGDRAKLSNKFIDCKTDKDRAKISLLIQDLQGQIGKINEEIRFIQRTGITNTTEENPEMTTLQALKKKNSLLVMISQVKREIEKLAREGTSKSKIDDRERRLKELNHQRINVERTLKEEDIQAE